MLMMVDDDAVDNVVSVIWSSVPRIVQALDRLQRTPVALRSFAHLVFANTLLKVLGISTYYLIHKYNLRTVRVTPNNIMRMRASMSALLKKVMMGIAAAVSKVSSCSLAKVHSEPLDGRRGYFSPSRRTYTTPNPPHPTLPSPTSSYTADT